MPGEIGEDTNVGHLQAHVRCQLSRASHVSAHAPTPYGLVDAGMRAQGCSIRSPPPQLKYDLLSIDGGL
jgi:hypothetical protein